jgi:hypothetical protein
MIKYGKFIGSFRGFYQGIEFESQVQFSNFPYKKAMKVKNREELQKIRNDYLGKMFDFLRVRFKVVFINIRESKKLSIIEKANYFKPWSETFKGQKYYYYINPFDNEMMSYITWAKNLGVFYDFINIYDMFLQDLLEDENTFQGKIELENSLKHHYKGFIDSLNTELNYYKIPMFEFETETSSFFVQKNEIFYKWLIDLIPFQLLQKFNAKKYHSIVPYYFVMNKLKCQPIKSKGIFKKKFFICKCNEIKFYVAKLNLEFKEIDFKDIYNKQTNSVKRYWDVLKELVISYNLNILSLRKSLYKGNYYPISENFVKTIYITHEGYKKYCIIQERLKSTLYDFINKNVATLLQIKDHDMYNKEKRKVENFLKIIYFQVIYALYCAHEVLGFIHNDLHLNNLMIKIIKDKDYNGQTYILDENTMFKIPKSFRFIVKIIDFNRSHISKPLLNDQSSDNSIDLINRIINRMQKFSWSSKAKIYDAKIRNLGTFIFENIDIDRFHRGFYIGNKKSGGLIDLLPRNFFKNIPFFKEVTKHKSKNIGFHYRSLLYNDYFKSLRVSKVDTPNYVYVFRKTKPDDLTDDILNNKKDITDLCRL